MPSQEQILMAEIAALEQAVNSERQNSQWLLGAPAPHLPLHTASRLVRTFDYIE